MICRIKFGFYKSGENPKAASNAKPPLTPIYNVAPRMLCAVEAWGAHCSPTSSWWRTHVLKWLEPGWVDNRDKRMKYPPRPPPTLVILHCCCLDSHLCLTLWDPMGCSPPGSSVHGSSQARTLEWVAISFSRGSSWPKDGAHISCLGRCVLYRWATREAHLAVYHVICWCSC